MISDMQEMNSSSQDVFKSIPCACRKNFKFTVADAVLARHGILRSQLWEENCVTS